MILPEWADEDLSKELPVLRARGEGQALEFMGSFPANAREIGKEIAAFATSNPGLILIGVDDSGDLVGLDNTSTASERDSLVRRIEGICHGPVQPAVTPTVSFAIEEEKVVLVVSVARGDEPVYYCQRTPYLRHLTASRPAEPHEVVNLVSEWSEVKRPKGKRLGAYYYLLHNIALTVGRLLISAREIEERTGSPFRESVQIDFEFAANSLRKIAADDLAEQHGIERVLLEAADAADQVAQHRLNIRPESWARYQALTSRAAELGAAIRDNVVSGSKYAAKFALESQDGLRSAMKTLDDLARRSSTLETEGRFEDAQSQAAEIGEQILLAVHLAYTDIPDGIREEALRIGRSLHLMETRMIFLDGGVSIRGLMEDIREAASEFRTLLQDQHL
jgi:hypothetical protein